MHFSAIFNNIDLFTVGIVLSALVLLGTIAYLSNPQSMTARSFCAFAFATVIWNLTNFFQYQFSEPNLILLALRLNLFAAVWHAYFFFRLSFVFPKEQTPMPWWNKYLLIPVVSGVSLLTFTPLVFSGIASLALTGEVPRALQGPAIALFGICAFGLLIAGLMRLMYSRRHEIDKVKRTTITYTLIGMTLTALLILLFNLVLPLSFNTVSFLPFAGVFMLPVVFLISYSVYKHHLFNIKALAAQGLTFILGALTFTEVVTTHDPFVLVLRCLLLVCIVGAGIALTRSVMREIGQRELIEKQEKELEVMNTRLRDLDQQKNEFLSFASHQLRTPLTAIKWSAGAIIDGMFGTITPELKEPLHTIFDESVLMAVFINDYLNVSRIEQGRMEYRLIPTNMVDVIKTTTSQMEPAIHEKGLSLVLEAGPETAMIWGDASKLTQVISNLIDNSIKYTPKGTITVSLRKLQKESKMRIEIKDTGIGMDAETLGKVFDKFSRGENAKEVNSAGSGLGLFIVKTFVEAHKGKVWIESEGVGHGSRFIVEFPLLIQK